MEIDDIDSLPTTALPLPFFPMEGPITEGGGMSSAISSSPLTLPIVESPELRVLRFEMAALESDLITKFLIGSLPRDRVVASGASVILSRSAYDRVIFT